MRFGVMGVLAAVVAVFVLAGAPGLAHHSVAAKFDESKPMTVSGVVTLVDWRNPHVHVFLNVRGQPYADTRDYALPGGNPLRRAHATACRRVGVRNFTPHDWRHHWASWCVMSGVDLVTLKRMGGWASLAMVDRYAALDTEHMAAAVRKLA